LLLLLGTSAAYRRPGVITFSGLTPATTRLVVTILVSLIVLAGGLYVILSHEYQPDEKKWGYGIVGTVVGYWLKG